MTMPRLGLTTTRDRIAQLAGLAERQGLVPVPLTCISIVMSATEKLERARADASEADWIVITSSRAVEAVWPEGEMPDIPVAAVGSVTASAVRDAGGKVSVVGDLGSSDLVAKIRSTAAGRRVFFPHAATANVSALRSLLGADAEVSAMAVYETRPVAPPEDPVDAVIFGSPSAVAGWFLTRSVTNLVVGAIGETTRAAIVERGHDADFVPARPDFAQLVALLGDHLRERSPT